LISNKKRSDGLTARSFFGGGREYEKQMLNFIKNAILHLTNTYFVCTIITHETTLLSAQGESYEKHIKEAYIAYIVDTCPHIRSFGMRSHGNRQRQRQER
jgi:hypothetical protein